MNEQNILLGIAIFSTTLFCIKLILMGFTGEGADTELDMDLADDADGSESFEYLSIQTVLTFLMMFSWSSLALKFQFNQSSLLSYSLSSFTGLLTAFSIGITIKKIKSLETKHPKVIVPEIGEVLTVTNTIYRETFGEVKFVLNNNQYYLKAYTDDNADIKKGSRVKIIKNKPSLVVTTKL